MYPDLRSFVAALERAGELKRIRSAWSPVLEIAWCADRASKSPAPHPPSGSARRNDPRFCGLGGYALLFENVEGSEMPVLINALGSYRRMEMALGCQEPGPGLEAGHTPGGFDAIAARLAALVKPEPPRGLRDALRKLRTFLPLLRVPPRRRRGMGACQEVVETGEGVDLTRIPMIRCWPHDGDFAALGYPPDLHEGIPGLGTGSEWEARHRGRYITLGGVHTIHADDRDRHDPPSHNVGMYRVQLMGPRRMAMHWHMHHDGARHWRSWKRLGRPMPVAIALGGESVLPYAATAPMPPGMSELLLAGLLQRSGIEMVRARTVPLWVPANAEMVIEGWVSTECGGIDYDPRRAGAGGLGPGALFEGPFGDHTGFYSMPDRYPMLEVTAVTRRREAIFPATVVGLPPQEDYFMGKATERIFLPLLRTILPDIEDYDLPLFGAFHNCAFVKIRKQYPLHARRVMHGVWGAGQMSWTKSIFVVDAGVDVHDVHAVLSAAARHCHPARDVETVHGPLDILDHAAPWLGAGVKSGFDCTPRMPGEDIGGPGLRAGSAGAEPPTPERVEAYLSRVRGVPGVLDAWCPAEARHGWLLVRARKDGAGQGVAILRAIGELPRPGDQPRFVIVVGEGVDVRDLDAALFHWLANSDAGRDSYTLCGGEMLGYDATPKVAGDERDGRPVRPWPPILAMSEEVKAKVESRRGELGLV
jgi:4-hydroxy-3-polyprenylbenzoate decarboxylase